ncbi:metal-dependent hydrolase [Myroides odoratimimus]|uniref:metal-dependent hydrolase n=1 Tax=Myroides odoratimimus TaxID=76832 RepID=UPI00257809A6|nr:metal-dependent hydrolase [Myroides odoratimimus]MDM1098118.1 metal-dependent hydrolase [Myroides odoratimimus]MDM1328287.1 metal-dependent hydrolase [Myroides odoratimimus]MDM1444891.1 metal-dependent hydrolase [Myroides odoratimimus]MDM1451290.1 metal-dependent hydrolase [Myroides odoratimimus]MDM1454412.1 metal-dependent hydrolase [Myroides odoratimimus]
MEITYYGHACLGIRIEDINIIVDPFITGNPLEAAKKIDVDAIKVDYILITHAHGDHIADVERIANNNPEALIVSNAEIAGYYEAKGFQAHPMNHGGSWIFDFGKLKYTPAIHSSSFPDGSYGGQPGGFVIESKNKNIYIAGDTSLTMDMKLIPMFTNLDLAILPIGSNFTMDIDEAVVASDFVKCDKVLGYHFDTFGFIEIDHEEAKRKFFEKGKDLMLLNIGESLTL